MLQSGLPSGNKVIVGVEARAKVDAGTCTTAKIIVGSTDAIKALRIGCSYRNQILYLGLKEELRVRTNRSGQCVMCPYVSPLMHEHLFPVWSFNLLGSLARASLALVYRVMGWGYFLSFYLRGAYLCSFRFVCLEGHVEPSLLECHLPVT
ncbi:hypothetical protein V6N12_046893 [Hibiscus sabdariffa]|uniref:Uncharacterized protein n=1 Tax=Hibiscus sabdariffa TaxID=183260 RepID=A0ABR2BC78_9ROSI